jgi:hypothetical protein
MSWLRGTNNHSSSSNNNNNDNDDIDGLQRTTDGSGSSTDLTRLTVIMAKRLGAARLYMRLAPTGYWLNMMPLDETCGYLTKLGFNTWRFNT